MKNTKTFIKGLYISMLRIRLFEESLVELINDGTVRCPVHLCTGQEAVAAGVCAALNLEDYIFGSHRFHGHYLAKGGGMSELVAEIYGKETGCSKGRGGSMHLVDPRVGVLGTAPIVAGTIALALGSALAASIRKDNRVTVSFFGDGATGEGVLSESLNFAAIKKLPIIFACENNLYSTHMPIGEIRVSDTIFEMAHPFTKHSYKVDGNDVLEVYENTQNAVELCRSGYGPVFLEFLTYRMRGHVGPDDNVHGTHTDIRPKKEIDAWHKRDPIAKIEKYINENNILTNNEMIKAKMDVRREIEEAHEFARSSPYPAPEALSQYVFKS